MHVENQLAVVRKSRGIGASDLARRVGVSRQTIHAIEAGDYVPNTEVALRLARELEVTVEVLFSLPSSASNSTELLDAEVLSATAAVKGQSVQIGRIGSRWITVPVSASPYYLPEADGVLSRFGRTKSRANSVVVSKNAFEKRLIVAGCDPATSLLARMVERIGGAEVISVPASSRLALTWLREGKVHVAGSHLEDPATGEFNLPFLEREFPGEEFKVVTFARWEEGIVVAGGNRKGLRKIEDLARRHVRFLNREPGSGSRALLDRLLNASGVPSKKINGYDRIAYGHLAAAGDVASGKADCCIATRSAAQTFGLDFVPLHSDRYDFVICKPMLELPALQAFLDVLQRAALRRKLEVLAGYDTSQTGAVLV